MNIAIIVGTSRHGRMTPRLAAWVYQAAMQRSDAAFELVDLADYPMPLLEEAPWLKDRHIPEPANRWLERLEKADGLIIVTAEYNHTIPAVLKNALDYTHGQLKRKPIAIVSHGVNSGVRANEHLRQIVNSNMGAFTISATVAYVGNVEKTLHDDGSSVVKSELNDSKLQTLLDEITWYTRALKRAKEYDETN